MPQRDDNIKLENVPFSNNKVEGRMLGLYSDNGGGIHPEVTPDGGVSAPLNQDCEIHFTRAESTPVHLLKSGVNVRFVGDRKLQTCRKDSK